MLDLLWKSPSRADGWRIELLNNRDVPRRELTNVTGGSLDWNIFRAIMSGGDLTFAEDPRTVEDIDWSSDRFKITYIVEIEGNRYEIPMGVYLAAGLRPKRSKQGAQWEATLLDKTTVLQQDKMERPFGLAAGANVTFWVRSILNYVNERRYAITDSDQTLRVGLAWKPGTPRLQIVNDLLNAINYFPLYADGDGVFRAEPYEAPNDRNLVWDFGGSDSITSPSIDDDYDLHSVPNRYVVVTQESEDVPALIGVAENRDPSSPFSYQARGERWITATDTGVEAANQEVADSLAARRLNDSSRPVIRQEVKHLPLPIRPNQSVLSPDSDVMTIVEQKVVIQPMTLMTSTLRRFFA